MVGTDRVNLTGRCGELRKCSPIRPLAGWAVAAAIVFVSVGCHQSREDAHAREVATRVRTEFLHAWTNYEKYAWGHDGLKPLSKTPHDWYGQSLLMTPVDALDTLILMKLDDEAAKARSHREKSFVRSRRLRQAFRNHDPFARWIGLELSTNE